MHGLLKAHSGMIFNTLNTQDHEGKAEDAECLGKQSVYCIKCPKGSIGAAEISSTVEYNSHISCCLPTLC